MEEQVHQRAWTLTENPDEHDCDEHPAFAPVVDECESDDKGKGSQNGDSDAVAQEVLGGLQRRLLPFSGASMAATQGD